MTREQLKRNALAACSEYLTACAVPSVTGSGDVVLPKYLVPLWNAVAELANIEHPPNADLEFEVCEAAIEYRRNFSDASIKKVILAVDALIAARKKIETQVLYPLNDLPAAMFEDNPILQGKDFVLSIIRNTIRNAPKMEDQTHWDVPGVGRFDLEGNLIP